jgi:oxysterol-binding protein-related protein 8
MYARGILFGKMKYELGDHASVRCPETGLEVDIEFKVKGWVSGSYNSIGGYIKETKTGKQLYELSGYWHGEMSIKDLSTGKKEVLFDASHAKPSPIQTRPIEEQGLRESQRLWQTTTQAIKKVDHAGATESKTKIEDEQRREAAERGENAWQPKLFKRAPPGDEEKLDWIIDAQVDDNAPPEKEKEQILAIAPILPGSKASAPPQPTPTSSAAPAQEKPLPSAPPQKDGGGDLIDFGQNDNPPPPPPDSAKPAPPAPVQRLQEPLQPRKSGDPGEPIRRMDSMGNEDMFVDAES